MMVPAARKFPDQHFVPKIERFLFSNPAQSFRMAGVPSLAFMLGENIPKSVQLTMLGKQMLSAQIFWMDVPDAHASNGYVIIFSRSSQRLDNSVTFSGVGRGH